MKVKKLTVEKKASHATMTAKLTKDRNPSPKQMKTIEIVACNNIALRGVLSLGLSVPKREGRKPSFPATYMSLEVVKKDPEPHA